MMNIGGLPIDIRTVQTNHFRPQISNINEVNDLINNITREWLSTDRASSSFREAVNKVRETGVFYEGLLSIVDTTSPEAQAARAFAIREEQVERQIDEILNNVRNISNASGSVYFSHAAAQAGVQLNNIDELVSFIERHLHYIDNNPNISDDRRDVERQLFKRGAAEAISGMMSYTFGGVTATFGGDLRQLARGGQGLDPISARRNMERAMEFAQNILERVGHLISDPEIQEMLRSGVERFLNIEMNHTRTALFVYKANNDQANAAAASSASRGFINHFQPLIEELMEANRNNLVEVLQEFVDSIKEDNTNTNKINIFRSLDTSV